MDSRDRSYVAPALLSFLLWWIGLGIIGLVVNVSYIREATDLARRTGRKQSGTGCLWLVLVFHMGLWLAACIVAIIIAVASLTGGTG